MSSTFFQGDEKFSSEGFGPPGYGPAQKGFVMNMQFRQCFARAKPFRLKKANKAKYVKKSQNFKIWLQKRQIGNPGSKLIGSGFLCCWSLLSNSNIAANS